MTVSPLDNITASEKYLDQIRGSLIGGAVGDALGYTIEFQSEEEIATKYGPNGITEYELSGGKARFSDDTQMTLFTANGILVNETRRCMQDISEKPRISVAYAYYDWLKTQTSNMLFTGIHDRGTANGSNSWLMDVTELYARRAPGNTCLSGLKTRKKYGSEKAGIMDYIDNPINYSKGCGGIMRIAPIALKYRPGENYQGTIEDIDMEAAQIAAITHSHSLGYMPAAVAAHVINRCITSSGAMTLKAMVIEARDTAKSIFAGDEHLKDLVKIIDLAIALSENDKPDRYNIHMLGEGWVGEEALGIAIYCALKYQNDFSKAIIVSVNHRGDSDSTGAVTGNILGALLGYEAIEEKWKKNLELHDLIIEMADDLCYGCRMNKNNNYQDPSWTTKYIKMHRYQPK